MGAVQSLCADCGVNKQACRGKNSYRVRCQGCHNRKYGRNYRRNSYRKHVKDTCERCGFVPVHICQLDVHHVDGDNSNDAVGNLQTLCANCHRLITYLERKQETEHGFA